MSTKEQRRQKKLAKKRSKEIAKRKEIAREKNSLQSLAGQIKAAASGPVDRCLISSGLTDSSNKFGSVFISRKMRDGRVAVVKFLVDGLCLGVKDIAALVCFPADQSRIVEQMSESELMHEVSPAKARSLVEGAVAYAQQFEIEPHADYRKIEPIWGDVDKSECTEEFVFGDEEGKPRYVNGPYDSVRFQQQIREKLQTHAGEGNYNIVTMMGGPSMSPYEGFGEDEDWSDDPELDADIDEDVIDGKVVSDPNP
ncbi:hypothetical protein RMSM_04467 [Rhodopirellula maiorica SM1]|uniref:Uncharacterized protein n=1 Tax=Rhodopirellula maiorica SM1 TaxID=1265738 RepID=M5RGV0_9BACT|nr:hypothetical protein [Rhodopirellula maiorica]EMI18608.1 hypothetical protein RMSM_04467 [Rhodopirellula maiorica SM1]